MDLLNAKQFLLLHDVIFEEWKCHMFMHYPEQCWMTWERNYAKVNKSHQIPTTVTFAAITSQATRVDTKNVETIQDEHSDKTGKCDTYTAIQSPKVIEKCSWSVFAMSGKILS